MYLSYQWCAVWSNRLRIWNFFFFFWIGNSFIHLEVTALCFLCPVGKIYPKKEEAKSKGRQWQVPRVSGWRCKKTGREPVCVWLPLVVVEGPPSCSVTLDCIASVPSLPFAHVMLACLRERHIRDLCMRHEWCSSCITFSLLTSKVYLWLCSLLL